jgi:DNA repair photolyase
MNNNMEVVLAQRKSAVLASSSLACLADIPAINLTAGCAHNCVYCYARGYSTYPGDGKVVVYQNTLDKLKSELANKRAKPESVYFSPSTDIFQPVPEVLAVGYSIFEFLFSRHIGISFLTKGSIPEKTMALFLDNAVKVKAQIGIITPDEKIRQIFEPGTVDIAARLKQMERLTAAGIEVEARMMPILPGITDNPGDIEILFKKITAAGVTKIAISTLFLRPTIAAAFHQLVSDKDCVTKLLHRYSCQERIPVHAKNSSVIPLLLREREEIYSAIKEIAAKHQIEISICGCMNPDIGGTCNIARKKSCMVLQPSLFGQIS